MVREIDQTSDRKFWFGRTPSGGEDGLHETVEGQVESFAPWSAFRRFAVTDGHLVIELAGDLWANIPRRSIAQGDAAFDEVVGILRSRQIPERKPTSQKGRGSAPGKPSTPPPTNLMNEESRRAGRIDTNFIRLLF